MSTTDSYTDTEDLRVVAARSNIQSLKVRVTTRPYVPSEQERSTE